MGAGRVTGAGRGTRFVLLCAGAGASATLRHLGGMSRCSAWSVPAERGTWTRFSAPRAPICPLRPCPCSLTRAFLRCARAAPALPARLCLPAEPNASARRLALAARDVRQGRRGARRERWTMVVGGQRTAGAVDQERYARSEGPPDPAKVYRPRPIWHVLPFAAPAESTVSSSRPRPTRTRADSVAGPFPRALRLPARVPAPHMCPRTGFARAPCVPTATCLPRRQRPENDVQSPRFTIAGCPPAVT